MQYRIITKENRIEIHKMEAFVKHYEKSHFLQTPAWADVKEAWDWRGILAYEAERIVGAMSVLIRNLPLGFSLMYAPRGPVCDRNDPYVLSCLLFALSHVWGFAADSQTLTRFLVLVQYLVPGFVLAWSYDRSGTLWTPIALHAVYNALALWT